MRVGSPIHCVLLLRKVVAGGVIGVALAAPLIVAALNFVHGTDLHNHDVSTAPGMHLAPSALPQLLLPYIYGPIFGAIYPQPQLVSSWSSVGGFLTTSLVMFGLLGLVSTGRRGLRIMLAVWIAVSLLLMYAHVAPLTDAVRALPGMSRVIIFRFEFAPLEFAVIVLAALGLDAALHHPARRRVLAAVAATLVLVAGAAVGSHHLAAIAGVASSAKPYWLVPVVWGAGIVIAAAAGVLVRRPAVRAALLAGVVAIDAVVLFAVPQLSAPRSVALDLQPVRYLQAHAGLSREFGLGPLAPNYGAYFAVASLNNNDLPPKPFDHYVHTRLDRFVDSAVFTGKVNGGRSILVPSPEQELLRNLDGTARPASPTCSRRSRSPRPPQLHSANPHGDAPRVISADRPRGRTVITLDPSDQRTDLRREHRPRT